MDTDIRDEIDRSFDDGPPIDDLDLILTRGHQVVRRRRLAEGASLLLVAGVVVGIAVASSGTTEGSSTGPAGQSTSSAVPSSPPVVPDVSPEVTAPDALVIVDEHPAAGAPAVRFTSDGFIHTRSGVEILRTVADPFDRNDVLSSAAVEYVHNGTTHWFVGAVQKDGMTYSTSTPARAGLSFESWVAASAPVKLTDTGEWPGRVDLDLVRFAGDTETLEAVDGVTILEQTAHPDLPDSFATAADRSAVAVVRFEGERWYVLARRSGGSPPQYIAVSAQDGGPTLTSFLAMAQQRYAEGGGGLL